MLATTERVCINHIGGAGTATGIRVWLLAVSLRRLRRSLAGTNLINPTSGLNSGSAGALARNRSDNYGSLQQAFLILGEYSSRFALIADEGVRAPSISGLNFG